MGEKVTWLVVGSESCGLDKLIFMLKSAINLAKRKQSENNSIFNRLPSKIEKCKMFYYGHEPLEFMLMFPNFEKRVTLNNNAAVLNCQEYLDELNNKEGKTYTFTELQNGMKNGNLPEGVTKLNVESFLNAKEFEEKFGMSKEDF